MPPLLHLLTLLIPRLFDSDKRAVVIHHLHGVHCTLRYVICRVDSQVPTFLCHSEQTRQGVLSLSVLGIFMTSL